MSRIYCTPEQEVEFNLTRELLDTPLLTYCSKNWFWFDGRIAWLASTEEVIDALLNRIVELEEILSAELSPIELAANAVAVLKT